MIYRSNLTCPDLTPHFKHLVSRPLPHSFGHDVPSDWGDKADDDPVFGIYKRCGMWTHDEAAILYNVARTARGVWCDIGAHTGWTSAHISSAAGWGNVDAVDPMLIPGSEFSERFSSNTGGELVSLGWTSAYFLSSARANLDAYTGFCIDGDHEPGEPLKDAQGAAKYLAETGVIIFHDFIGKPVREAVTWLMDHGFRCRVYFTPHMVACCWRGDYMPPRHVPDPELVKQLKPHMAAMKDFDFGRCE